MHLFIDYEKVLMMLKVTHILLIQKNRTHYSGLLMILTEGKGWEKLCGNENQSDSNEYKVWWVCSDEVVSSV